MKIEESDLIKKLAVDPEKPGELIVLQGYVGRSSDPSRVRLYETAQKTTEYIEIKEDSIRHVERDDVLGTSRIYLEATTLVHNVQVVRAGAVARRKLQLNLETIRSLQVAAMGPQAPASPGPPCKPISAPACTNGCPSQEIWKCCQSEVDHTCSIVCSAQC
jgi:hypothetical protein